MFQCYRNKYNESRRPCRYQWNRHHNTLMLQNTFAGIADNKKLGGEYKQLIQNGAENPAYLYRITVTTDDGAVDIFLIINFGHIVCYCDLCRYIRRIIFLFLIMV